MNDPITWLLLEVLQLYWYVVIAWTIMSMLISFGVINPYQNVVRTIFRTLEQLVEPALRPIRRILPPFGALDLSPLALLLLIGFAQHSVVYLSARLAGF